MSNGEFKQLQVGMGNVMVSISSITSPDGGTGWVGDQAMHWCRNGKLGSISIGENDQISCFIRGVWHSINLVTCMLAIS
jgi:hypothetical protein